MNMKVLLENWKKYSLLSEGMRTPEELPEDVFVAILDQNPDYYFYYSDAAGNKLKETQKLYGSVMISKTSEKIDGKCFEGMTVVNTTNTKSGWGPLLYDLAIEFASIKSTGLMSDRSTVSNAASRVWEVYMNSRSDIKVIQMDNLDNELTDSPYDNCAQDSAENWADERNKKWLESPLSKIYKKTNSDIMQKLKKLNKLIVKND